MNFKIPIIEYEGDLDDFFGNNVTTKEIFVRINSTGSPLKKNEIRHALYANLFFDLGKDLEKKYTNLFVKKWRITSIVDVKRYVLHEYILELCTAIHYGNYTDRRKKLDELLSSHHWTTKEIALIRKTFIQIIEWAKQIFPRDILIHTRFKNKSDFYSLFIVLLSLINKGYVTTDLKSNRILGNALIGFSRQVQLLNPKIKAYEIPKLLHSEQQLNQYVISTRQSTDSKTNREIRHNPIEADFKSLTNELKNKQFYINYFNDTAKNYFMIDLYPENISRFALLEDINNWDILLNKIK